MTANDIARQELALAMEYLKQAASLVHRVNKRLDVNPAVRNLADVLKNLKPEEQDPADTLASGSRDVSITDGSA